MTWKCVGRMAAGASLIAMNACGAASSEIPTEAPPRGSVEDGAAQSEGGNATQDGDRDEEKAPLRDPSALMTDADAPESASTPVQVPPGVDQSAPSPAAEAPAMGPPKRMEPRQDTGRVAGLELELDDGSYVFLPYSDQGLDYCSMVWVHLDGSETPHRPPDVRKKCAAIWAERDAVP